MAARTRSAFTPRRIRPPLRPATRPRGVESSIQPVRLFDDNFLKFLPGPLREPQRAWLAIPRLAPSTSSSRRTAGDGRDEVARVLQPQGGQHVVGRPGSGRPWPRRAGAAARGGTSCRRTTRRRGRHWTPSRSSSHRPSNGRRVASRSTIVAGDRAALPRAAALSRRSRGVVAKTARTVSLNWRMLANPAAKATSREPQVGRLDEQSGRCARAGPGPAPGRRRRPRRPAAGAGGARCSRAGRRARRRPPGRPRRRRSAASPGRRCRPGRSTRASPGTASGRQRRQARKPASWAAAAVGKKRTLRRFGVVAGQLGRQ